MPSKHRPLGIGAATTVADFPEVAVQWHPRRNAPLRATNVRRASSKKVWWKCPEARDHEWQQSPNARILLGAGCPFCSGRIPTPRTSLAGRCPEIAAEWHPRNTRTVDEVRFDLKKRFWWKCPKGPDHEWLASIADRTIDRRGCPCCAGTQLSMTSSLAWQNPLLALEWHPKKNGSLTPADVTPHSSALVWWRCGENPRHVWRAAVGMRAGPRATGCPECWVLNRSSVLRAAYAARLRKKELRGRS